MVKNKKNIWDETSLDSCLLLCDSGTWGKPATQKDGIPILRSTNIKRWQLDLSADTAYRCVSEKHLERCRLNWGDIIVTKSSGSSRLIGQAAFFNIETENIYLFSNFTQRLRPNQNLTNPKYLYYYLRSPRARKVIEDMHRTTSGLRNLVLSDYKKQPIPIPYLNNQTRSLETQRRIVARIEDLFAELGAARRIHAALVDDAEQLSSSASNAIFTSHLFGNYPKYSFAELIVDSRNGLYKPQTFYGSGTPIVRIDSFEAGKIRRWDELKRLEITKDELKKFRLQIGDVLINRVNGSINVLGKAVTVDKLPEHAVFESNIMRFRLKPALILPEFVVAFLTAEPGRTQIRSKARAIQQFSINQSDVGSIKVPVPSIDEQHRIVAYLDEVQEYAAEVKHAADAMAADMDRLEQSILVQAFRGMS